jgi:hypothetical protein
MSAAAALQLAGNQESLESLQPKNWQLQPGHTVWLYCAESLNLAGRHLPADLQHIKAHYLVACPDHYYLELDQDEGAFNAQGDGRLNLVPTLKSGFSVADEIKTFAGMRGCEILDGLVDKPISEVQQVYRALFGGVPDNPTLQDRLAAVSGAVVPKGYESVQGGVVKALTEAIIWRESHLTSRLASPDRTGNVRFTEQERIYFAESELEIPAETSANRAEQLAETQGGAMGDAVGKAIAGALSQSRNETAEVVKELVTGIKDILAPVIADVAQLKGATNGSSEKGSKKGSEGVKPGSGN